MLYMWLSGYIYYFTAFSVHCTVSSVYEGHTVTTRQRKNISCLTFPFGTFGRVPNIAADTASQFQASRSRYAVSRGRKRRSNHQVERLRHQVDVCSNKNNLPTGLIQHISFQLLLKNARMKQNTQTKTNWCHKFWSQLQSEPLFISITHPTSWPIKCCITASQQAIKLQGTFVVTDCIVSVNKFRMRFQGCQAHLNGSSRS